MTDSCALVGAGLDAQRHALYAEAHAPQDHPSELVRQAVLPPGTAGVELAIPRPPAPDGAADPEQARLAQRFSLLLTALAGTYAARRLAPPLAPLRDDGSALPLWRARRLARAARLAGAPPRDDAPAQWWRYEQVVPVTAFGPPSVAPAVAGLPRPDDDPYRGYGDARALPQAEFALGFADLLGNATAEPFGTTVSAPVGYTDPLLGLRAWPATTSSWTVARGGDGVALTVAVAAQPATAMPAPDGDPVAAAASARQQAQRLEEAYFQLVQPTVRATLLTTLVQAGDGRPAELPLSEGTTPLWRYLAGATLYARAAAALEAVPLGGAATVAQVVAEFGATAGGLAAVNGGRAAASVLRAGQPLGGPRQRPQRARRQRRDGGGAHPRRLAETDRGRAAGGQRERAGAAARRRRRRPAVHAGARARRARDERSPPSPPARRRRRRSCAVDAGAAPLLAAGFAFVAQGQTVVTDATVSSFAAVRDAFAQLAVEVALGELADGAAERTGLLAANALAAAAPRGRRGGDDARRARRQRRRRRGQSGGGAQRRRARPLPRRQHARPRRLAVADAGPGGRRDARRAGRPARDDDGGAAGRQRRRRARRRQRADGSRRGCAPSGGGARPVRGERRRHARRDPRPLRDRRRDARGRQPLRCRGCCRPGRR